MSTKYPGKVMLAGAGPGDPELITLKLQRVLKEADVIITDRLVHPDILTNHARADAEILFTGKQGYNEASYTQEQINELIRSHALQGKRVLRLKGGDVAFFSNVLDELKTLIDSQIPFEIIPGITAASGASAYAGIPLTARGYSQAVQILTFNPNSHYSQEKWKQLATSDDTLVFYMAARNIHELAEILLRHSRFPRTPLAVIEQATTAQQQVYISCLEDCRLDFKERQFVSPSLVIIGKVVGLSESFNWFLSGPDGGSVFREVNAG